MSEKQEKDIQDSHILIEENLKTKVLTIEQIWNFEWNYVSMLESASVGFVYIAFFCAGVDECRFGLHEFHMPVKVIFHEIMLRVHMSNPIKSCGKIYSNSL